MCSIALWAVEKSGILSSKFWTKAVSVKPGHIQLRVMPWAAISACFFKNRKKSCISLTKFECHHRNETHFSSIYIRQKNASPNGPCTIRTWRIHDPCFLLNKVIWIKEILLLLPLCRIEHHFLWHSRWV